VGTIGLATAWMMGCGAPAYRDSDARRECRAAETEVALALEPDGSVGPVSSEGELAGSCVERVLGALRFPEPRGGGRVLLRFGLRVGP